MVSVLTDAVLITLIFALAALGLAIIFGLIGVINMGHGAMLTLGAYLTWAAARAGVPFPAAALLAALGVAAAGLVFEHFVLRYFYDRLLDTLLLTWGFFLVATEVIKIVFGTDIRTVVNPMPGTFVIGPLRLPAYRTVVAGLSLTVLLGTAWIFYRTTLGLKVRALIDNREMASLLGMDVGAAYKRIFAFGAFITGLAGALISPLLSVYPYIGDTFLVRSFFVVIVGGVGQLLSGTVVGGFIIGGSETLFALFASQAVAQTVVFALAIVVLRFRPSGVVGPR
jgi:branched-subunit amino acid ABC-type transport system permease component